MLDTTNQVIGEIPERFMTYPNFNHLHAALI